MNATNAPNMQDDMNKTKRRIEDEAHNAASAARQSWNDAAHSVKDASRRVVESGRIAGREGVEHVERMVHERPVAAIAVAGLIGFLIGSLTTR